MLTFAPATVTANVQAGNSATVTVRATAVNPSLFGSQLVGVIVDGAQVLLPDVQLAVVDARTFSATPHPRPTLAARRYQGSFDVAYRTAGQAVGSYSGSVTVRSRDGQSVQLDFALEVRATRFTINGSVLSRSLTVRDNYGGSLAWTASSDAAWLSVTASGNTGSATALALNADAALLPADTLALARVTLSTTTPGVDAAVLRVAAWKSASGITTITTGAATTTDLGQSRLAADPLRPWVYVHGDGAIYRNGSQVATSVIIGVGGPLVATADGRTVFNLAAAYDVDFSAMAGGTVFAGQPAFLAYPGGGNTKDVAVSPDGSRIYVADAAGLDVPGRYFCAALDASRSFVGALPGGSNFPNNVAVTWDGRAVCGAFSTLGPNLWLHAPGGALLATFSTGGGDLLDRQVHASADGLVVAALVGAFSPSQQLVLVPIGR